MCLALLKQLISQSRAKSTVKPTSTKRIAFADLHKILRGITQSAPIHLSDRNYLLCNKADIKAFLATDTTNRNTYVQEKFDCDDFAYRLMGQMSVPYWSDLAFGILWTDTHALNCFIDEAGEFYLVEPQTDEITKPQDIKVRFIIM